MSRGGGEKKKEENPMSDSLRRRYLNLLKASLLNELYIENEARLLYMGAVLVAGQAVDFEVVRDISRRVPGLVEHLQAARMEGRPWWYWRFERNGEVKTVNLRNVCEFTHSMIGRRRLDNLEDCLDRIRAENIPGDVIEAGVWRGGASLFMRGYLAAYEMTDRKVWLADSFEGMPKPTLPQDAGYDYSAEKMPILAVSLEEVQEIFRRYGLLDEKVEFLKGWFKETLPGAPLGKIALARLDGDLYESTRDSLEALYRRVEPGGFLIVDDYGDFEPCRRAVDEFRGKNNISASLERIDWTGVYWRKP